MLVHNDRVYMDAEVYETAPQLSTFKHWQNVIELLEDNLRDRGIKEYYGVVSDATRYRFAKFFGFKSNLEVINDTIEVVRKELF